MTGMWLEKEMNMQTLEKDAPEWANRRHRRRQPASRDCDWSIVDLRINQSRWFDSSTGRWIIPDPTEFAAGDTNEYRYAGNSPANGTDPNGCDTDENMINRAEDRRRRNQPNYARLPIPPAVPGQQSPGWIATTGFNATQQAALQKAVGEALMAIDRAIDLLTNYSDQVEVLAGPSVTQFSHMRVAENRQKILKMLLAVKEALKQGDIPFEYDPNYHSQTEGALYTNFVWGRKVGRVMNVSPDFFTSPKPSEIWHEIGRFYALLNETVRKLLATRPTL